MIFVDAKGIPFGPEEKFTYSMLESLLSSDEKYSSYYLNDFPDDFNPEYKMFYRVQGRFNVQIKEEIKKIKSDIDSLELQTKEFIDSDLYFEAITHMQEGNRYGISAHFIISEMLSFFDNQNSLKNMFENL